MTQLENRLDKAIKRLNTRQAETRTLRDNIDGLRKERLALNEALAKLDGQLSAQRQDAARLLRISQSGCMGRDKVLSSGHHGIRPLKHSRPPDAFKHHLETVQLCLTAWVVESSTTSP